MPQNNGRGPGSTDNDPQLDVAAERPAPETNSAEDAWDATEAVTGGRHGGMGIHHRHAAFHRETAAHHHREAAKHAGAGNHEDAKLHAEAAHTHGKAAGEHLENARKAERGGDDASIGSRSEAPSETKHA
jgi:hypothetical protein